MCRASGSGQTMAPSRLCTACSFTFTQTEFFFGYDNEIKFCHSSILHQLGGDRGGMCLIPSSSSFTAGCNAEVRREDSVHDEVGGAIRVAGRPNHHGSGMHFHISSSNLQCNLKLEQNLSLIRPQCTGGERVRADGVCCGQWRQAICSLGGPDGCWDQHRCAVGDVQAR